MVGIPKKSYKNIFTTNDYSFEIFQKGLNLKVDFKLICAKV